MSLKGTKRGAAVRGEEAGASKRRRTEPEDALWQLRPVSDLKMSSIYNRSASEAPAELFRKDLISAMKLPDSEQLASGDYWVITDTWKQDWERGVQVPVNPDSLPAPKVKIIDNPKPPDFHEFKLPRDKYIHLTRDSTYQPDKHVVSASAARAEAACSYDMDATDVAWLRLLNAERARAGAPPVVEDHFEKVIEELEKRTWDKIQSILKSEEGLGIEYDENVICDVCRSPESEDGNEMVFCDSCNICVHQACYGITVIPDGQWLCRPCGSGVRPTCVLCPNLGGAMKCTPSGHKWAHVSCVLWIPEVSIGCAENMEPITKISSIPASRWSLVCVLCRERKGACIQCSVKTCKTAYHVTCAFKHGLEMRAIIEDENADDGVKLRSYCQKHSVNSKKEKCPGSGSEEEEVKRKRRKDMTSEEKTQARAARLHEVEAEFDRHVTVKDISSHVLDVDQDAINYIYNYWKLKRRAGGNRPLLPPKSDDNELLIHRQEQADLDKMKMFVQLRQDLERVRNLCYMVSRREKLSRSFFRMREQTFHKQVAVLTADSTIAGPDLMAIIEANHGPSIYDRLYSHADAADHKSNFDALLARIAPPDSGDEKKKDRNGLIKGDKSRNPYKKHYVNGSRRSESVYSGLSSEESAPEINRTMRYRNRAIGSSTEDEGKKSGSSPKKKVSPKTPKGKRSPKKGERKKKKVVSKAVVESSSEDEDSMKTNTKKDRSRSKTLQQMEKEMTQAGKLGQSGTDSDELITVESSISKNSKFPVDIYSDSSDEAPPKSEITTKSEKSKSDHSKSDKIKSEKTKSEKSQSESDAQQPLPRTKAAMKEFIPTQPEKKVPKKDPEEKPAPKKRGRKPSNKEKKTPVKNNNDSDDEAKNKENIKMKQKDHPTDLIVPQRQAAKKASENMRSTTIAKKEEPPVSEKPDKVTAVEDIKVKTRVVKSKGKESKEIVAAKVGRKKSSKDLEKETIAYVPQRQAAKKAAAHIKSGLGTKAPAAEAAENDKKKESDKSDPSKLSPIKDEIKAIKTSDKDSSSSSSNSSSSSYSSSSSSEEETEKHEMKPTAKAREIKPLSRQPSLFSPPHPERDRPRPTVDLPFLDKVSRPLSSTSASSDSESSKASQMSGSTSPYPKRPRRRRKGKSLSTDTAPLQALDKKLKTSERGTECGVSTPTVEREESSRPNDTRAATRTRTRSTTSSGNIHKPDARQRKPSKDDAGLATGPNKTPKESSKPSELHAAERKANAEINARKPSREDITADNKTEKSRSTKSKRRSGSTDDKDKTKTTETSPPVPKNSPRKSAELRYKTPPSRRMSVKEPTKSVKLSRDSSPTEPSPKERRISRHSTTTPPKAERLSASPCKRSSTTDKSLGFIDTTSPVRINEEFAGTDKVWLPKAPSPMVHPPPVEKPGGHEKYMTEDKAFDSDSTEKSSLNMLAKIQATLNENTMIKSPKTPMDARSHETPIDLNPVARIAKKRSVDSEKKYITQDVSSHVQGVEISKSAKIPSTANPFPHRSIFSPKDNELFDLDMMAVDDAFNNDDIMKPFTACPELFFKEDSKEQGVQETLNLVDRLRLQLSTKKAENATQDEANIVKDDKDLKDINETHPAATEGDALPMSKREAVDVQETRSPRDEPCATVNHHVLRNAVPCDMPIDLVDHTKTERPISMTSNDKWPDLPPSRNESPIEMSVRRNYADLRPYTDEIKEPATVQSDMQSVSEIGDSISLSKQSDDSQSQSLSVVDHSVPSIDNDLTQDNQTYDNNNSLAHSECPTRMSSPYIGHEKWRESKITTRRSSASSTNSEGSLSSQKDIKAHINCEPHPGMADRIPDIDYPPMPAYSCPVEPALPLNQYSSYPPESPFLNAISSLPLFPGAPTLPLPSPGPGMYASSLAFGPSPLIQPLAKPTFPTLCAAFTSSSQNIALTTAMIAPPTPKPMDSPRDDLDVTCSDKFSIHAASSPSISVGSYNEGSRAATKMSNDSSEPPLSSEPLDTSRDHVGHDSINGSNSTQMTILSNSQDSKSPPPKAHSRSSYRFPGKSPGKSPAGISPKQSEGKGTKRSSNKSNRSQRGRGRSKSRAQGVHGFPPLDYMGNSIQSKLVGTVYDFKEEFANEGVDLKSLRERRKSVDVRDDRRSEYSYKDRSQSPRLTSPQGHKRSTPGDSKETSARSPPPTDSEGRSTSGQGGADRGGGGGAVPPLLPGPVDMRTYQGQGFDSEQRIAMAEDDPYRNPALPNFMSGTVEQQLADLDEEVQKRNQTLIAKLRPRSPPPVPPPEVKEPPAEALPPQPKVSLSDSRNQLKVKIKGPFLDANYLASSLAPPPVQPPVHTHEPSPAVSSTVTSSSMVAGSTNLRRMRKKELLRQYCTQDMHMDDPTAVPPGASAALPPAVPLPLPRAVITIPKAVASMTSIPTREDYKIAEPPPPVEKKKRKTSGLSRELRHLEVSMNDDVDSSDDVKLSSLVSNAGPVHKRRGRGSAKAKKNEAPPPPAPVPAVASTSAATPTAPKLKIKIGNNVVQPVNEDPPCQFKPPKKRPMAPLPKPSLEDLRRESMKYRRQVMADFEEDEKPKKHKPSKSEKRKRKKEKKAEKAAAEKLEVVNSESDSATKLIIKIKRTKEEEEEAKRKREADEGECSTSGARARAASEEPVAPEPTVAVDPFEYDPSAPDPLALDPPSYAEASSAMRKVRTAKVTPIRLKLARSSEGSGYVMKEGATEESEPAAAPAPAPAPAQPPPPPAPALKPPDAR